MRRRSTCAPPIVGQNAAFDPNLLSQLKIDRTGGAVEDLLFQITFDRDPFFDLEQFFKIVPDRRPSTAPLAIPLAQTATSFRSPGVDFLKQTIPANALTIVIEVPKSSIRVVDGTRRRTLLFTGGDDWKAVR
jgi:hypothetical protein